MAVNLDDILGRYRARKHPRVHFPNYCLETDNNNLIGLIKKLKDLIGPVLKRNSQHDKALKFVILNFINTGSDHKIPLLVY